MPRPTTFAAVDAVFGAVLSRFFAVVGETAGLRRIPTKLAPRHVLSPVVQAAH